MSGSKGILERLHEGPVIGDGGFCHGLEKRGYVTAGPWTPECVVQHPDAVKQYHREFLRSGSDVMQAFTFYATEDKITASNINYSISELNTEAIKIAREVANEGNALVSASITRPQSCGDMLEGNEGLEITTETLQNQFREQMQYFDAADFIICELFFGIEEMECAIKVAKESHKPVAATMCLCDSDVNGVSIGECAVRMVKAGADIVGVNCFFDLNKSLNNVKIMKEALNKAGHYPYLMVQPVGYVTADVNHLSGSYVHLPEAPFALESRTISRFEVAKWARECHNEGIHYIGGCCGFEPYHIRAISEELSKERGQMAKVTEERGYITDGMVKTIVPQYLKRAPVEYWKNLQPKTCRAQTAPEDLDF